jgi:hypothetical protein
MEREDLHLNEISIQNSSSEEENKIINKSKITIKSNNKSEYNKNILLNYSKGLNLDTSIRYTRFEEIDYNTDLLLKNQYSKHKIEELKQVQKNKFYNIKSLNTVSKQDQLKSVQSKKSCKFSKDMKSSRSIRSKRDDDSMDKIMENMKSLTNERNISIFNTNKIQSNLSGFHDQNRKINEINNDTGRKNKMRFSGKIDDNIKNGKINVNCKEIK